jgi:hypothetical protein
MSYNGSAVIAMAGHNCVAICSDLRLGVSQQTLATDFQKVFKIHDRMYVGLSGLATDMQTLYVPPHPPLYLLPTPDAAHYEQPWPLAGLGFQQGSTAGFNPC